MTNPQQEPPVEQEVRLRVELSLTVNTALSREAIRRMLLGRLRAAFGDLSAHYHRSQFAEERDLYGGPRTQWQELFTAAAVAPEAWQAGQPLSDAVAQARAVRTVRRDELLNAVVLQGDRWVFNGPAKDGAELSALLEEWRDLPLAEGHKEP